MTRPWLWLLAALLFVPASASAQVSRAGSLSNEDLVARTRASLEEIARLDVKASADEEALRRSASDLRLTIERLREPLPERPLLLDQMSGPDEDFEAQIERADTFYQAWKKRQSRYDIALGNLDALEPIGVELRATYEELLDRIATARPLLIEAKRRIGRREVEAESFQLEGEARALGEWIGRTEELLASREELFANLEQTLAGIGSDRRDFEELEPNDPELARLARRTGTGLRVMAEGKARAFEQRARLQELLPETLSTEVLRIADEWRARNETLRPRADEVSAALATLDEIESVFGALEAPQREETPAGDEPPDVREARADVAFGERMIDYYREYVRLAESADAAREEALVALVAAQETQAGFTRQTARAIAAIQLAAERQAAGELPEWEPPEGASQDELWSRWSRAQMAALDWSESERRLRAALDDTSDVEAAHAQLARELESQRLAEAHLETELSYAEFVVAMGDLADAELLELVAADGEVARSLDAISTQKGELDAQLAAATEQTHATARAIRRIESPYSRLVLRRLADQLPVVRSALEGLQPLEIPADESEAAVEADVEEKRRVLFPDTLRHGSGLSATDLSQEEEAFLRGKQLSSRVFLEYCEGVAASLEQLKQDVADRARLDAAFDEQLNARIREEKRRYAAAIEIQARLRQGQLTVQDRPAELDGWLGRESLREATHELRSTIRDKTRFHQRAAYEVARLEKMIAALPWARVRAKAADKRAKDIGRPVARLTSALKPLEDLGDVERKNLEYEAQARQSSEEPGSRFLLERFTKEAERERFQEPLGTFYLELANTDRVIDELTVAEKAYDTIAEDCAEEREALQPARLVLEEAVEHRLFDYHAARYAAAAAMHPGTRGQIEEAFRNAYERELPYRLNDVEQDPGATAGQLIGARARLVAQREMAADVALFLSKVGLEQEIGWYQSQAARVRSLLDVEESRKDDLLKRIGGMQASYAARLKDNAIRGLGTTLAIPFLAYLIVRLLRGLAARFEHRVVRDEDEDATDRQRRLQTITRSSTAAISLLVYTIAIIYMFAQLGLDITPIVASASVVGLAVAFGAQALIKDFFYGFFILIENQFTMGDIVDLGGVTGTVEKISLRITVLRDLQGVVHYIPNGSIGQVSNKTQGWSQVVMEISVSHKADPDHASAVLGEVLLEMSRDPAWRYPIIEDPVVAGVQNLTERAVDIRVMIKTRPGKQWEVAREARLRIKKRFDAEGIEIPFPQRVVHHVYSGREAQESAASPRSYG